jgi:hypothetical protein
MAFTSAGLAGGGRTAHYQISYDTALPGGLALAVGLLATCEGDFNLMSGWFAGVSFEFSFPLPVQIVNAGGGASWSDPPDIAVAFGASPTITVNALNPPTAPSVGFLRYLLVSEVTEMFMASQNKGWYEDTSLFSGADEGSKGEGLSRFLGVQFQLANSLGSIPPSTFGVVPLWLNSPRANFVDNNPDDKNPDPTNGCTTCFLYYLNSQLGRGIANIIAAGASNLAGVYQNLTSGKNAWNDFSSLVNSHYPPGFTYNPVGDDIFPVSELSQFFSPNQITAGYSDSTQIFIDRPAMAEVNIKMVSDDPTVVTVPPTVTVPVGKTSATVTFQAAAIAGPFPLKSVQVHASYAGNTMTATVDVVPPRPVSLTLTPDTVTSGDPSTATITLNLPSLNGPVVIDVGSLAPGFAQVSTPVTIPQGQSSISFPVTTTLFMIPIKTSYATIIGTYSGVTVSARLTIKSKVVAGILNTLTVFPALVTGGFTTNGTVTLVEAVPTPTVVGLAALEAGIGPLGHLPRPSDYSSVASVPPSITIPAGQTSGAFSVTTNHDLFPGTKRMVTILAGAVVFKYVSLTVEA